MKPSIEYKENGRIEVSFGAKGPEAWLTVDDEGHVIGSQAFVWEGSRWVWKPNWEPDQLWLNSIGLGHLKARRWSNKYKGAEG
jgi:hypothetical protein